MRFVRRRLRWLPAIGVLFVVTACSSDRASVYPVRGTVTFEGKPIAWGGSIAFMRLGNQAGKDAGGEIKEDGTYQLTTYREGDGAMAGEFRVVITQVVHKEPERTSDGEAPPKSAPMLAQADHIPLIYADSHNSPLTAKVEAKSMNEINFHLKRK